MTKALVESDQIFKELERVAHRIVIAVQEAMERRRAEAEKDEGCWSQ